MSRLVFSTENSVVESCFFGTRCNSLQNVLQRFVLLKENVQKILIDITFTKKNFVLLEVLNVLIPVKLALERRRKPHYNRCCSKICTKATESLEFKFKAKKYKMP